MLSYLEQFWGVRLKRVAKAFEKNGYDVTICKGIEEARQAIVDIVRDEHPSVVANGDSMTLRSTGALDIIKSMGDVHFIDCFDSTMPRPQRLVLRREALMCDLFLSGVNAITEKGQLVWLDMIGNRIAPIAFGPKAVVIVVGRNKITPNIEEAMSRIKRYSAPVNAIKHTDFKTPCQVTGECHDCSSPDRICNSWLIMEKSFPPRRIKLILVDEDLGL